jgi:hypothetical protein
MDLSFVKDLNESSQYRTRFSLANVTPRVIADHAFIDMITLWILYNEYDYAPTSVEYARKTLMFGNFDMYRQSSTDLYMTLHILISKNLSLVKHDESAKLFLQRIHLNPTIINVFLKKITNNSLVSLSARQVLQKLERELKIEDSNYRSIRRLAQNWGFLTNIQKSLVITKILQFYNAHASRSELMSVLSDLAEVKGFIIDDADIQMNQNNDITSVSKLATLGVTKYNKE